jgi:very-short-patch-repair endonuclease
MKPKSKRPSLLTDEGRLAIKVREPKLIHGRDPSPLEEKFYLAVLGYGPDLPRPQRDYQFVLAQPTDVQLLFLTPKTMKPRAWSFSVAWPFFKGDGSPAGGVAVVVEDDQRCTDPLKLSAATRLKWTVIRITEAMLVDKVACVEKVRAALMRRGWKPADGIVVQPRKVGKTSAATGTTPTVPTVKVKEPKLIKERERSELEETYLFGLRNTAQDLPPFEEQYRFAPGRQYRADFAWPQYKLAIELQGACFMVRYTKDGRPFPVGRHNGDADKDKMNLYAALGWHVLQFSTSMLKQRLSQCIEMTRQALIAHGWTPER